MTPATKKLLESLNIKDRGDDRIRSYVKKNTKKTGKFGHPQSEETKKKIAETLKARKAPKVAEEIKKMLEKGMSAKQIAFNLNRTLRSVQCLIYRMKGDDEIGKKEERR